MQSAYGEQVDIYYSSFGSNVSWSLLANDLNQWTSAGKIKNIDGGAYNTLAGASSTGLAPAGVFNHILLVDKSPKGFLRNQEGITDYSPLPFASTPAVSCERPKKPSVGTLTRHRQCSLSASSRE